MRNIIDLSSSFSVEQTDAVVCDLLFCQKSPEKVPEDSDANLDPIP